MSQLFEYIDSLTSPYEAFWVDSRNINDPTRPHWHYYIEVIYVEIGELYVECEEHRRTLSPGDCAIFHSRMIHTMAPVDRDNYRYGVIKFDISRLQSGASFTPRLRSVVEAARKSSSASLFFSAGSLDRNLVSRVFNTCVRECDDKRYGSDLVVHSNLCELMVALARFWRAEGLDIAGSVSTGYTGGIQQRSKIRFVAGREDFILCVMMVNTVGEEYALGVNEKVLVLRRFCVDAAVLQNGLQGMADTQVVLAVLVPEDVAAVFGGLCKMEGVFFLLKAQVFPSGNAVAHDFEVRKGIDGVLEIVCCTLFFGRITAGHHEGGTSA